MELSNIKNELAKLRMTPDEKAAMKAGIFGMPAPAAFAPQQSAYFAYSFQFVQARVLVPALAVVLVFGGVGTAAAAQGSLPGELLYPVKISINEVVEVALATTPVAKAEVSAKLAERRVEEAEVLASRGELNPQVGEELAANFEEHAQNASAFATELEAQNPDVAMSLRAKLDSSLLAHGAILATLTEGGAEANQEGTGVVAAKVLARTMGSARVAYAPANFMRAAKVVPAAQTMTMSMSIASDTATSAEAASNTVSLEGDMIDTRMGDEQAALGTKMRAQEAFAATRALFDRNKSELSSAVITQVSGEFAAIEDLMELGSTTLATEHYTEARGDYTEALRRTTRLSVLLRTQARLEVNIITPILEQNMEVDPTFEVNIPGL